jgi:hypothetical protein
MKKTILFFCLALSVNALFSQDAQIDSISKRYKAIKEQLQEDYLTPAQVNLYINRPAIGEQITYVNFYWNNMTSEEYSDGGLDSPTPDYTINREVYMVTTLYNVAASVNTSVEYLYDDQGKMIFAFYRESAQQVTEKRFYYVEGKLYKYIYRLYERAEEDGNGSLLDEKVSTKNFPGDAQTHATKLMDNGIKLSNYFKGMFALEDWRD